jgi:LacI family transcriptional regulator
MRSKQLLTVALIIESGRAFGRGLLRGIARYARTQGNWSIAYHPWEWDDKTPRWLMRSQCDGVIARIDSTALLQALQRLKIPVVDVRRKFRTPGIPMVGSEYCRIAQLAADHLREQGFRNFGYCGYAGVDYSARRRDDFVHYLKESHFKTLTYEGGTPHTAATWQRESAAMFHERELGEWLRKLPKPIGIMACNDLRGRQVLNACKKHRITVPDEVAVIGVDNDEVLCELADPPLSSVIPATDRIGYEAAALLDKMMHGHQPPSQEVCIEPLGVATRHSTDVLAVEDQRIAKALRFIRDHACEGISVENVLDHLGASVSSLISRSTLEHRFAEILGRSPKAEIMRVRLQRVRQLLIDTDWTLPEIATRVGIKHAEYLSIMFKSKFGQPPGEFRRHFRCP